MLAFTLWSSSVTDAKSSPALLSHGSIVISFQKVLMIRMLPIIIIMMMMMIPGSGVHGVWNCQLMDGEDGTGSKTGSTHSKLQNIHYLDNISYKPAKHDVTISWENILI